MVIKEELKVNKLFLIGLPLIALYVFYHFEVVGQFNKIFYGFDLLDLNAVKELFDYYSFGKLHIEFEVTHLVGYQMVVGLILLSLGEIFVSGRFLNIVRIAGGGILLCAYFSFFLMEAHSFCADGFWTPILLLLLYFMIANSVIPDKDKVAVKVRIGIILFVAAIFTLTFMSWLRSGGRVYDIYRDSSQPEDLMVRYATYCSYVSLFVSVVLLKLRKRMPVWVLYFTFVMALLSHIFVFYRYRELLSYLSMGYYFSLILIIAAFIWLKGTFDKEGGRKTKYEKLNG